MGGHRGHAHRPHGGGDGRAVPLLLVRPHAGCGPDSLSHLRLRHRPGVRVHPQRPALPGAAAAFCRALRASPPPGPEGRFPGLWPFQRVLHPAGRGRLLPDRQVLQEQGQALGLGGGGARGGYHPAVRDFGHGLRRLWGAVHFAALPVLGEQARPHHRPGLGGGLSLYCGEQFQRVFLAPVVGGQPGPVLVYG